MFSLQQLNNFIKIAELGSFANAAKEQFISSTALIQQMNLLEQNLGFKLLKRTKKGVELTDAGMYFYEEMRLVLAKIEEIVTQGRAIACENANQIKIGYTYWHPSVVASRIAALCIQHKLKSQISIVIKEWKKLAFDVENGELDAGIIWENRSLQAAGLKCIVLDERPLLLGIPISNSLKEKDQICLEDLNGQSIVVPPRGTFEMTDSFCDRLNESGINYKLIIESGNIESNMQCIQHNACRISADVMSVEHSQLVYRPILTNILYRVCFVYRTDNEERLKEIIDICRQYSMEALSSEQSKSVYSTL